MDRFTKDPVQLQQKLIYVQSELKKEQERIDQFKKSYNYQYIERLKQDNHLLEVDKEELERHLYDLEEKLEKYKRQIDVANLKVKMYQDAWEKIDQQYQELKEEYRDLKENYTVMQDRLFDLKSELQRVDVLLIEKNQNIEQLEKESEYKTGKIEKLEFNSQSFLNENQHYRQQTESIQKAYGHLEGVLHQFLISHLINQLKGFQKLR